MSHDSQGLLTVWVSIMDPKPLRKTRGRVLVRVSFDLDPAVPGRSGGNYEYRLLFGKPKRKAGPFFLQRHGQPNKSMWHTVRSSIEGRWRFAGPKRGVKFRIPLSEIGSPCRFDFRVDTYFGRAGKPRFDFAPNWAGEDDHWHYQVRDCPPETSFTATPAAETVETAEFVFASSELDSTFECSLNGAAFEACISPVTLTGLAPGLHTFQARATDAAGNTDASPALHAFVIEPEPLEPGWAGAPGPVWTVGDGRPSGTHTYTTGPESRVLVHYWPYGYTVPSLQDGDSSGVPDYVEKIAEAADAALATFSRLGFRPPPSDSGGPDGRIDIYVTKMAPGPSRACNPRWRRRAATPSSEPLKTKAGRTPCAPSRVSTGTSRMSSPTSCSTSSSSATR